MQLDAKTREALDIKNLRLPPALPVTDLTGEEYTDSTGDPALRVSVTIAESTDLEKVPAEAIGKLKSEIRDSLRQHGVTIFPYIFLAKPSELAKRDED
jgi:hypothetical protein